MQGLLEDNLYQTAYSERLLNYSCPTNFKYISISVTIRELILSYYVNHLIFFSFWNMVPRCMSDCPPTCRDPQAAASKHGQGSKVWATLPSPQAQWIRFPFDQEKERTGHHLGIAREFLGFTKHSLQLFFSSPSLFCFPSLLQQISDICMLHYSHLFFIHLYTFFCGLPTHVTSFI